MPFRPDFGLPPAIVLKTAAVNVAGSGDNTIVAAVAARRLIVFAVVLVAGGTVNVRFEDGAGGTAFSGQIPLVANTGFASGWAEGGHFVTSTNTLLNLELSGAVSVQGWVRYAEIP